jgi:RNA polymerase sigma-70 factor (ECF subfamily)
MSAVDAQASAAPPAGQFAATHWSLIVAASDRSAPQAREALSALCTIYWYPLYAFVRRQGYPVDEAQDLTQAFFARLLEKDGLAVADPEKGKFRSFLLASLKHFLANERDRANALKRGGGVPALNFAEAEGRYLRETGHTLTPEKLFERRWALTLLDQALTRVRAEYQRTGRGELFEHLHPFLTGAADALPYHDVAEQLAMTPDAVKVAVHRLRRRYRDALRDAIARTVYDPAAIDDEIRDLFQALA